jgi:hypothetical protein
MTDPEADVPYGEDFHDPAVATAWAESVMRKRPWRTTIFEHFVAIVRAAAAPNMASTGREQACPASPLGSNFR